MLERLVQQDAAVRATLHLLDRNNLIIPMEKVTLIRQVIDPCEKVTREMSSDSYVSISKIITLSKALQRMTVITGNLSEKLSNRMMRKFSGIEEKKLLGCSTLIDPRLKKLAFIDSVATERIDRNLGGEAAQYSSDDVSGSSTQVHNRADDGDVVLQSGQSGEDGSLWQLVDQHIADSISNRNSGVDATTEVQQYLKKANISRKDDPIAWWKSHTTSFPLLHKMAKKYLSIPGTSVPSERLFSTVEVISAKRNRLIPEHVNIFLFLNKYFILD